MGIDKSGSASSLPSGSAKYIRSYFILDPYTGTIHTAKLLDLENFCDLNACKNRVLKVVNSSSIIDDSQENCLLEFKIKATRTVYSPSNSSNPNSSIYHISFGLVLKDVNEFRPEFLVTTPQPIWFNVSEEFAPIRLAVGSVAYDNDCNDRGRLRYQVKVIKVNGRPIDDWIAEARHLSGSNIGPYSDYIRGVASNRSTNMFEFQVSLFLTPD